MLSGKKVLLGITGSIAAYKSVFLTRLLIKAGAEVKVILTPEAREFVTPLTLSTLSKNPVLWEYFDPEDEEGKWNKHVDLALWADLMIIAPLTASTLSKMAAGQADNFLMGVYLSAKCPVYFAPAMDLDMYKHPSTKGNIERLQNFGNRFIPSGEGELASGLSGEGRMAEPEEIITFMENDLKKGQPLSGKKVLVNGGPTYEAIDPVRFIGNHSSGKMGIAIAEAASAMGAEVTLVLGPTHLTTKDSSVKVVNVVSANDMFDACQSAFEKADIALFSAAVSDYRPKRPANQKIKKSGGNLTLELVENPDILAELASGKRRNQLVVGFALETENAEKNAIKKLHKKKCDLIVLNSPGQKTGFGKNTNAVSLIDRNENIRFLDIDTKENIAHALLRYITSELLPAE